MAPTMRTLSKDVSHDITVNVDITVFTRCSFITVDVVDVVRTSH